jgi:NADPH:quinone reductase-like Zn-dependent oxidoreductase
VKPARLTFEEAAVMPYAGYTAWQAVHDHGHVKTRSVSRASMAAGSRRRRRGTLRTAGISCCEA